MSLIDIVEDRMQQIFESGASTSPLPFKKLAKQAVKEIKRSSLKDGQHVYAPSLFTILVNPSDDAVIAPLYQQVTDELVDFLQHSIQNDGLELMAPPMVRFLADPNVKPGKTEVIGEVVTADVAQTLRQEESAYAKKHSAGVRTQGRQDVRPAAAQNRQAAMPFSAAAPAARQAAPAPAMPAANPAARQAAQAPAMDPARSRRAAGAPSCQLTDTASGRTWRVAVESTVLGRDDTKADLVLDDTNVSRAHARLERRANGWWLCDLKSTNGTRVNGSPITECKLSGGDTISMGLVTLEFKEL